MPDEHEVEEARERTAPGGHIVYEAIRQEGEDELGRPSSALAYSGLAAGLSMGFSFLGTGLLRASLPDASWAPLVSSFGYALGFLIVILGRQQLFTENTLTVILPLMQRRRHAAREVARVWAIVLVANVIGGLAFAAVVARTEAVDPAVHEALRRSALDAETSSFAVTLLRGVFAGWMIALVVWLLPFAESARVWVIVILTYIVGLAQLSHVIVGTIEAGFLVFVGERGVAHLALGVFLPALVGNILGGVTLVAALNHAQVVSGTAERG